MGLSSRLKVLSSKRRGYTIIELLVAVGLFSVVATIAIGGLARALNLQRKATAMLSAGSNLSIALEQMAREIRTGYLFCLDPNAGPPFATPLASCGCSGPPPQCRTVQQLTFINAQGKTVTYRLNNGAIEKDSGSVFQPITSPQVTMNYLSFALQGQLDGDNAPPRITIVAGASAPEVSDATLNLETTISARLLDR